MSAFDRAMGLAAEYKDLCLSGRVDKAEGARTTIEALVGRPVGAGRVELPAPVAEAMGRRDLASKVSP